MHELLPANLLGANVSILLLDACPILQLLQFPLQAKLELEPIVKVLNPQ